MKVMGVAVSVWGSQGGPLHILFCKTQKKVFTNKTMLYALPFSQDIEIFFVKGAFTNYLNMFLAFFDLIPTLM